MGNVHFSTTLLSICWFVTFSGPTYSFHLLIPAPNFLGFGYFVYLTFMFPRAEQCYRPKYNCLQRIYGIRLVLTQNFYRTFQLCFHTYFFCLVFTIAIVSESWIKYLFFLPTETSSLHLLQYKYENVSESFCFNKYFA